MLWRRWKLLSVHALDKEACVFGNNILANSAINRVHKPSRRRIVRCLHHGTKHRLPGKGLDDFDRRKRRDLRKIGFKFGYALVVGGGSLAGFERRKRLELRKMGFAFSYARVVGGVAVLAHDISALRTRVEITVSPRVWQRLKTSAPGRGPQSSSPLASRRASSQARTNSGTESDGFRPVRGSWANKPD